jgi:site-specific DNA-methyltransferase (adenine-specific)
VDAVVTDPPAGIKFMGADWDGDKGGRDQWIAWLAAIFGELLRVTKPGGHAIVWGLPRTCHWTAMGMENGGWRIRDVSVHLFGQGWPKGTNISKAIDDAAGVVRPIVGPDPEAKRRNKKKPRFNGATYAGGEVVQGAREIGLTEPVTEDAKKWDGWHTLLKPGAEHWLIAQKPLSEKTVVENVLKHGVGGIHARACALASDYEGPREGEASAARVYAEGPKDFHAKPGPRGGSPKGRFPANVTLEHTADCVLRGKKRVKSSGYSPGFQGDVFAGPSAGAKRRLIRPESVHVDPDGTEVVEDWECPASCAVRMLDAQSGAVGCHGGDVTAEMASLGYGKQARGSARAVTPSIGGASRFFYVAKASRSEKERGLEWMEREAGEEWANLHPTVKSIELMRWLCRLVTPKGGLIVDPFAGTGTTILAALAEDFRILAVEEKAKFVAIARGRVEEDAPLFNRVREAAQ